MRHFEIISMAGALYNEDIAGIKSPYAWVFDGATGLNKNIYLPSTSNAKWLVETWHTFILENAEQNANIEDLLELGLKNIGDQHAELIEGREIDKLSTPTAGMALIKWYAGGFEYLILGDCQIWVRHRGVVKIIKDPRINHLDEAAIEAMNDFISKGYSYERAREAVQSVLIENRLKANVQDGYGVLGLSADCLSNTLKGEYKFKADDEIYEVLLISDGYYALIDKYAWCDENQLFEAVNARGLEEMYRQIRAIEEEDSEMKIYPRFKKSDDASAIYLQIQSMSL